MVNSMKGQIFLMIGIIIIIAMILLGTSMSLAKVMQDKIGLERGLESQQFQNIKAEMLNSASFGYEDAGNMTGNLETFGKFARDKLKTSSQDLSCLLLTFHYPPVVAGSDTQLNVTIVNLLGSELENLTLSFESSNIYLSSVADGSRISTNFTFNTVSSINYTLSAYYKTSGKIGTDDMIIPVEIGWSEFGGLIDMQLSGTSQVQSDKIPFLYLLS
jgi:hypothetical protein